MNIAGLIPTQVLNKIIQNNDHDFIRRNSLDSTYFVGCEEEFNFIEEHYNKYGKCPDMTTFLGKFNDFQVFEVNETDDYLLDRLQEERGYYKFREILPEVENKLKDDSRDAYNFLVGNLDKLKPHTVCKGIDIIETASERYEAYLNRNNTEIPMTISTGFPELDDVFGGWEYGEELVTLVARTNAGKCFCKGTKVLMADGTLKAVEDIVVGDKVQSNGCVNTVTETHSGVSKGYKIIPNRGGEPFGVTDGHIMTFWHRNTVQNPKTHNRSTDGTGELIDMTIEDFLIRSDKFKRFCLLYRPTVDYPERELPIPPYILGLWLGDGTSVRPELTNMDESIIDEWKQYALKEGLEAKERITKSKANAYDITTGEKGVKNPVLDKFRTLNLLNNKHIPLDYLTSSCQQRLELLAGILDTDGCYSEKHRTFEITLKQEILVDNLCQLLRGLGFKATKHSKYVKSVDKTYYRIMITGALHEIPCRLERKKAKKFKNDTYNRNPQLTGFKIERIEEPFEYYGFECDGDHRFMLADNTLTHNSWLLMKFLAEAWKQGKRVGLYSGEMSHLKLGYRFDALFGHFSNRALVRGTHIDGYKQYIDSLPGHSGCFIIITQKEFGGRPTVQQIRNFIEENNIEIMGIDQLSLMSDGRASRMDPPRMRLSHIAEDLFSLSSEYKIPIIALAQANRAGINKENDQDAPGLEHIKESDDIAHNSSKCIGMRQNNGHLIIDVIKNREGRVGDKLQYSWDIDIGHFTYDATGSDAVSVPVKQVTSTKDRVSAEQRTACCPF